MIKAVIFDFFGVLVTEGFKQFQEEYFSDSADKRRQAVELINQVDSASITMDAFTSKLAQLAGISPQKVQEELGGNKPNKLLLNFIREELKGKYKVSILSNSSMDFPNQILGAEDVGLFDDIVLSYRFKVVKPDPEIYKIAAERLQISPHNCVFIDDSQGHINGAVTAGMAGIYYEDFEQMKKELKALLA